jgi:anti-sigma-K factor RskA
VTHDELADLVPMYALDALSGDEELQVRTHVQSCIACRANLESCQGAAAGLALMVQPVAPSAGLRQRVLQQAAQTRQLPALRPSPAPQGRQVRARRSFGWQQVTALCGVAALLVLGVVTFSLARQLHSSNTELSKQRSFIAAYVGAPVLTTVPMVAAGSDPKANGQVYVSASGRSAGLVVTGLPDPGKKVYQLWLIVNNAPTPLSAFTPDSAGVALVSINTNLSAMQGMAVTLENHAGNKTPQGPKVLQSA